MLLGGASLTGTTTWQPSTRLLVASLSMTFGIIDWFGLTWLPRTNRSFGPVKPPLLALASLRTLLTVVIGVVAPHLWLVAALHAMSLLLSIYATWIEPFRLRVTYQTLRTSRLDPSKPSIRLLHLSDLHVEYLSRRERELQRLIDQLSPDLIVFTGDFVNLSYRDDLQTTEQIRSIVSRWHAPLGVYCVSGTPLVESAQHVARYLEGSKLNWLRDASLAVDANGQKMTLVGFDGAATRTDILPRLLSEAETISEMDGFRLLLYHTPDVAPEAADLGFDLYLCGHTHGGQIRLPLYGAVITASELGRRFEMGRYQIGLMTLYVSRGIGMEGGIAPRARFLCAPEVILWTLGGASS